MYDPKYVDKAFDYINYRVSLGDSEDKAIAWAVVIFMLPYNFFIPEYVRRMGRCPDSMKKFLPSND